MNAALINIGSEAELLGALLTGSHVDAIADVLTDADFAEPVHGRIFAAIVREASLGKKANPVTIKGYFEGDEALVTLGGLGYLARLTREVSLIPPKQHALTIADLGRRRRMQAGLTVAADACADPNATASEIIAHADAALADNGNDAIHQPTGGQCFDELFVSLESKIVGVTCGQIPSFDKLVGPIEAKQFVILAARPGMGKTAVALSYAIGAARKGHGVLFVSLEMSSVQLAGRMAADICFENGGVPYGAIVSRDLSRDQIDKIGHARALAHRLPLQVVDAGGLTTGRLNMLIRRHARRMAANGHKLELVVVDYMQLMRPDRRVNKYEDISEVSMALKAMSKDHGVGVLALAQLSREVEKRPDKRPMLSDLRDSGQLEQDADMVIFLLRKEYYLALVEPAETAPEYPNWRDLMEEIRGQIEFIAAKKRHGTTGSAFGQFHASYQAVRG